MRTEPSADMRRLAHLWREMYVALVNEGFTAAEAMQIIGVAISASFLAAGE